MNKKWTGILSRGVVAIFAIAAGLGFYLFNAQKLAGNTMPMPFGVGAAVVLSGSMEPTLSVNDLVIVKEQESYQVNDIIVYQEKNHMVIHRVIRVEDEVLQTQGDANNVSDEPISLVSVKGKMIVQVPGVGAVVRLIKTPIGFFALFAAAICLLELSFRKEKKEDDDELERMKAEIRRMREEENN